MKLDILVLASHPDDAELSCSGTLAAHIAAGKKVGIVDLTRGELGTRGTVEIRAQEAKNAGEILGISVRENLGLRDGFFSDDENHCLEVIKVIRKYRPEIVIANAPEDRHPDHGMGGKLASKASFLSGLSKIETFFEEEKQKVWRPKSLFHYIQDRYLHPDFIVDITEYWDIKLKSIKAYRSQFYDPTNKEPITYISTPEFWDFVTARNAEMGHAIGVKYGEGFIKSKQLQVKSLFDII